jgi:hypothetical protein
MSIPPGVADRSAVNGTRRQQDAAAWQPFPSSHPVADRLSSPSHTDQHGPSGHRQAKEELEDRQRQSSDSWGERGCHDGPLRVSAFASGEGPLRLHDFTEYTCKFRSLVSKQPDLFGFGYLDEAVEAPHYPEGKTRSANVELLFL